MAAFCTWLLMPCYSQTKANYQKNFTFLKLSTRQLGHADRTCCRTCLIQQQKRGRSKREGPVAVRALICTKNSLSSLSRTFSFLLFVHLGYSSLACACCAAVAGARVAIACQLRGQLWRMVAQSFHPFTTKNVSSQSVAIRSVVQSQSKRRPSMPKSMPLKGA